jgi:DNA mismatch endonuclease, patch repair protein
MSLIRSRGNSATELRLIEIFREFGITGWRRNQPLLGKPDFIFRAKRVAVFVDGCFWHGCPKCYKRPGSNQMFWDTKIATNRKRDRYVNRELRKLGWQVVRIWQHQLKRPARTVAKLERCLNR